MKGLLTMDFLIRLLQLIRFELIRFHRATVQHAFLVFCTKMTR